MDWEWISQVEDMDFVDEGALTQNRDGFSILEEQDLVSGGAFGSGYFQVVYFQRGAVIYVSVGPGIDFTLCNSQPSRVSSLCID